MKKLLLLFVMLFSLTAVLVACGADNDEGNEANEDKNEETGDENTDQTLLAQVQETGELLIGTEGTYPPFTFHNDEGELTGFDVEIAREVANRLGVEPVFMETKWDAMFAGLNSKRFDMIANQVGIRPDREEKYDFSNPYISSSAVVVTNENNEDVTSFEDIAGLTAAQSLTSNYADLARENGAEIQSVEGFNESMQLLATNRVDVTINDRLSVLDYLNKKGDAPIKIAARKDEASQSGLMFRKGNEELVEAVNEALQEMINDGTYEQISVKWFGENVLN